VPGWSSIRLFCAAALLVLVVPGPVVLYTVARSLSQGRRAGLISVLAAAAGDLTHVLLATVGLAAVLAAWPLAFNVVRLAGAVYLVVLGVRTWLAARSVEPVSGQARSSGRVFSQGLLVAVLNPRTALFFWSFLPQFVDVGQGAVALQIATFGVIFVLLGMMTNTLWCLAASALAGRLSSGPRGVRAGHYLAGATYVALGLAAAVAGGLGG